MSRRMPAGRTVLRHRPGRSTVAVLHAAIAADAPPDERDSLVQVEEVSGALRRLGYRPVAVPMDLDLGLAGRRLIGLRPLLVFNLVEALAGSGRLIHLAPALLDELGLPFTGVPHEAMFLTSNKLMTKRWLEANGLPTPDRVAARPPRGDTCWIVKSVWEDASIGLDDSSVVKAGEVDGVLARRRSGLGGEWFAERYVEGREFNIALVQTEAGLKVLPVAEIEFRDYPSGKPRIVGYAAKWQPESVEYQRTVRIFADPQREGTLLALLNRLARRCWTIFGLAGYARVDFRVDRARRPWILEVNANPCLSADAGFAAALARAGHTLDRAIEWLVRDALHRAGESPEQFEGKISGELRAL